MQKLLIIEDDIVLAQTLQRRLNQRGYETSISVDPAIILNDLSQFAADVFLIDLRIGQQSGLTLIEPLRQNNPNAQIIVMTGFASIATAVNAIKLGANDYLPKPLDFKLLLATLSGDKTLDMSVTSQVMSPDRLEWEHIQKVLAEYEGNVSVTAKALGMHRRTLQRKLAKRPVGV